MKCVESLNSNERIYQDISYIEDYLKIKKSREDLLNSRIDSVCEDIKQRLAYAEGIWDRSIWEEILHRVRREKNWKYKNDARRRICKINFLIVYLYGDSTYY